MPRVIPVLDIKAGQVVHAVRGERANYAPIQSVITQHTDPMLVVADLLAFNSFPTLYLADLDAIMGQAPQQVIVKLCRAFRDIEFWVDAGPALEAWLPPDNLRPVIGTECSGLEVFEDVRNNVLSLDFDAAGLRGNPEVLERRTQWPIDVIAMCLHRVGSMEGPDLKLLQGLRRSRGRLIAAGGVRNTQDLQQLCADGMDVLVSSALHHGRVSAEDLKKLPINH